MRNYGITSRIIRIDKIKLYHIDTIMLKSVQFSSYVPTNFRGFFMNNRSNNRHALFAQAVNQTVEDLLNEEMPILRQELRERGGLSDQTIEQMLAETRIEMQKEYLVVVKKKFEDGLKNNNEEKASTKIKIR